MITVQFQELDKYQQVETDKKQVHELAKELTNKYPRLFKKEEVVLDVTVNENPHTLNKQLKFVCFIPNHGKIVADAQEKTFSQAMSEIKSAFHVQSKKLISERKN